MNRESLWIACILLYPRYDIASQSEAFGWNIVTELYVYRTVKLVEDNEVYVVEFACLNQDCDKERENRFLT